MPAPDFSDFANRFGTKRETRMKGGPELLHTLVDLYIREPNHSPDEERLFSDLVLCLINEVDLPSLMQAAKKLLAYPLTPDTILKRLIGHDRENIQLN